MLSMKYKAYFFVFFYFISFKSMAAFSDMDCFKSDFSTSVTHKAFPFGLTKNTLKVEKNKCELKITHRKLKYVKNKWIVDICRTPIHIKSDTGSIEVVKRPKRCTAGDSGDFCKLFSKIEGIIQDDGLIFAEGRKENITSPHGKMYCTYLLVGAHLKTGVVFDWAGEYTNVLKRKTTSFVPIKPIISTELTPTIVPVVPTKIEQNLEEKSLPNINELKLEPADF